MENTFSVAHQPPTETQQPFEKNHLLFIVLFCIVQGQVTLQWKADYLVILITVTLVV